MDSDDNASRWHRRHRGSDDRHCSDPRLLMEVISDCRACGGSGLTKFMSLGHQPLANALTSEQDQTETHYPLSMSWCSRCRLVQLNETVDPALMFSEYLWVTGTSASTRAFAQRFCNELLSRVSADYPGSVLEIG